MPPDAAVHTHAFDKARSGQQRAARRREASGPARLLPPAPEATGNMHGPAGARPRGAGVSFRRRGPRSPGTSHRHLPPPHLPEPTRLGKSQIFPRTKHPEVETQSPRPPRPRGLLSARKGMGRSIVLPETINVLLI